MKRKTDKGMTVEGAIADFEKDPVWLARQNERLARLRELEAAGRIEEEPILRDLRAVGLALESVWDLINTDVVHPESVPVLLEHFPKPYHPRIREGIVRALSVRSALREHASLVWRLFLREFEPMVETDVPTRRGMKDALANGLSLLADRDQVQTLVRLSTEPFHGGSRAFLVEALGRLGDGGVRSTLEGLTADPDVGAEAARALKKLSRRFRKDE